MKPTLTAAAVALLLAAAGPCSALWEIMEVTKKDAPGLGLEVRTEGELEKALDAALANTQSFSLINVHLDKMDRSPALARLATRLSKRI